SRAAATGSVSPLTWTVPSRAATLTPSASRMILRFRSPIPSIVTRSAPCGTLTVTSTQQLLHAAPRPEPAAGSSPSPRAHTPHEHRRDCTSTRTIHPADANKKRSERRSARNWPIAALLLACTPLFSGCAGTPQTSQFSPTSSASTLGVEADWNDIDAAVAVAVGRV